MQFGNARLIEVMEASMNDASVAPKQTKDGIITYCNIHCFRVAKDLGFPYFWNDKQVRPMTANEQYNYMEGNPHLFSKIYDPIKATEMAHNGFLVYAALSDMPHGHICPISPSGEIVVSGKFNTAVPTCYNVGKENKLCGINYAFREMPNFYICV